MQSSSINETLQNPKCQQVFDTWALNSHTLGWQSEECQIEVGHKKGRPTRNEDK